MHSLIPRLFPPPVFDRLQYTNTEGKAWEIWSHVVTSGRQKVDTRGQCPSSNTRFVSSHPWHYDGIDTDLLMLWPPALRPTVQEGALRFLVGHHPCVSTICLLEQGRDDSIKQFSIQPRPTYL